MLKGREGYLVGLLSVVYLPFYMFVPNCYTDTFVLPFVTGAVYLISRFVSGSLGDPDWWRRRSFFVLLASIGAVLAFGFCIKGSCGIVLIAILMALLFGLAFPHFIRAAFMIVSVFVLITALWGSVITACVGEKALNEGKYPLSHWIMMGLGGNGMYALEDSCFTSSFKSYDERKTAVAGRLKQRAVDLGFSGIVKHCFDKATCHCWDSGTCRNEYGLGSGGDKPVRKNILHEYFLIDGARHHVVQVFSSGCYLVVLVFALAAMLRLVFAGRLLNAFLAFAWAGGVVFFMMWETASRYSFHLMPIVLLLSALEMERRDGGAGNLCDRLRECCGCFARKIKAVDLEEVIRFIIAGGISTLADFALLIVLRELVFPRTGWGLAAAVGIAYVFGIIVHYCLSAFFVFKGHADEDLRRQCGRFMMFVVVAGLGMLWCELGIMALSGWVSLDYRLAKIIMTGVVMCWNYLLQRFVVFKKNNGARTGCCASQMKEVPL